MLQKCERNKSQQQAGQKNTITKDALFYSSIESLWTRMLECRAENKVSHSVQTNIYSLAHCWTKVLILEFFVFCIVCMSSDVDASVTCRCLWTVLYVQFVLLLSFPIRIAGGVITVELIRSGIRYSIPFHQRNSSPTIFVSQCYTRISTVA